MRKFSLSLPVLAMIVKQGKHFTTAKIFKKVCKTLFLTVTILSPNCLLNDRCFKIIVDTRTITEKRSHGEGDISTPFLPLSVDFFSQIFEHIQYLLYLRDVTSSRRR